MIENKVDRGERESVCMCINVCNFLCMCIHVYSLLCTCLHVCNSLYMCIRVCTWSRDLLCDVVGHTHTHTHTRVHAHTHTHTHTFPAQNGDSFKNDRTRFDSLDDRTHGCHILSQPDGTECALQRRAIYRCDFPRIAAGKTIFLHLGPSTEVSSFGGRTDNSDIRAWQVLGILS